MFVAGSVVAYNAFSSFESGLQLRATFAAVSGLALDAVNSGSASGIVLTPPSTIECEHDSLMVSAGSAVVATSLPVDCSFALNVVGGPHTFQFTSQDAILNLSVS